jgi:hypothetical protein
MPRMVQVPAGDPHQALFGAKIAEIRDHLWRPEVTLSDVPAPHRLAPYTAAMTAEVEVAGGDIGSGRLVVLHDPAGDPAWPGCYRVVAFVRAALEAELADDPMLPDVAWTWLEEALADIPHDSLGGTVTRSSGHSFGQMEGESVTGQVEVRASWSPSGDGSLLPHALAWVRLLESAAGLPPAVTASTVASMTARLPR